MNAKEVRAAAQAEKNKKIQNANAEREKKAEEERRKAEEERRSREEAKIKEKELKRFKLDQETRSSLPKNERKSLAKAAGLKSTFAVGNELYMTSFGKGNDAVVEKKISNKIVTQINNEKETFMVDNDLITETTVPIKSRRIATLSSQADNPLYRRESENKVQPDKLLLKDTLEKIYFGKTFDDTLHIQIIYNILDIEKILTVHSVNTVYALNNLYGSEKEERTDLISQLTFQNTYDEFINDPKRKKDIELFETFYSLKTLGYYGHTFFKDKKKRTKKEIYDILALIATIRQWCIHSEEDKKTWIYNADTVLPEEYINILDELYCSILNKINRGFVKDNKVNLAILSDVFNMKNDEDFEELIRQYYRFIITKEQKLLGFSITKVREKMLEGTEIKTDKKFDSVRSKLYKLIDFTLFYNYMTNPSETENSLILVERLRNSLSEQAKEDIYTVESERVWEIYKNIIESKIIPSVDENVIKAFKNDKNLDNVSIDNIVAGEKSNISCFSKIIYLLSQFIDGKEVNDLTTTLINKFDNIRSFIETARTLGLECTFTDEYKFFESSESVKNELHVIKNLMGMGYTDISVKQKMYRDAIDILGIKEDMSDSEIDAMIDKIICIGSDGKPVPPRNLPKGAKGFRNFIISNVIESSRFRYLVKYCNPKKIRTIANNKQIVRFVLGRISDSQIERYYYSCNPDLKNSAYPGHDAAINDLTTIIVNMKFDDFSNVNQSANVNGTSDDSKEKMKYQTIISLYLTVCYHLIKNLVNINARYAIACHSLERDARLYAMKNPELYTICSSEKDYHDKFWDNSAELLVRLLSDGSENAGNLHLRSKKWNKLMRVNLENYHAEASKRFRNAVVHLNPIRNADKYICDIKNVTSYYDIYHYIIQKSILLNTNRNLPNKTALINQYTDCLSKYNTYNKDFVKALCVPFGYNVVRFKSLSIYEMFDRNYPEESRAEKERKASEV